MSLPTDSRWITGKPELVPQIDGSAFGSYLGNGAAVAFCAVVALLSLHSWLAIRIVTF
jgi:hypothetical protein